MSLVRVVSRWPGSRSRTNTRRSRSTQNCRPFAPTTYAGRPCQVSSRTVARSNPSRSSRATVCSAARSEEHTSELQSPCNLVCRLLLEKKKKQKKKRQVRPLTTLSKSIHEHRHSDHYRTP